MVLSLPNPLRLCAALAYVAGIASAYTIQETYDRTNFFSGFTFFGGADPTHGYVSFASASAANSNSLAGYSGDGIYLGVDHTTKNPAGGRAAVRMTSKQSYTHGLFIADIAHMPGGICGVWPAFWLFGPNWPSSGEIDIIEGVNGQSTNAVTLHTSSGCTMTNSGSAAGSVLQSGDCNAGNGNMGCSQSTTSTQAYGAGFNAIGGGVYAMEWTSDHISIYFFPRNAIPGDIASGSPDPASWGAPQAKFSGGGCNIDQHFANHNIVFDTTFCGDWAGNVWSSGSCAAAAGTCQDFVANNPQAFVDAYWLINSVKVYQQGGASKRSPPVPMPFLA